MRFVQKDIKKEWSKIKDQVISVLHRSDTYEELYHKCRNKEAFLFTVPEGFIIASEVLDDNGEKGLYIWVAYGEGKNLLKEYEQDIDEMARGVKATNVSFRTTRKGFEKALSDKWYVEHIEYRKRIV